MARTCCGGAAWRFGESDGSVKNVHLKISNGEQRFFDGFHPPGAGFSALAEPVAEGSKGLLYELTTPEHFSVTEIANAVVNKLVGRKLAFVLDHLQSHFAGDSPSEGMAVSVGSAASRDAVKKDPPPVASQGFTGGHLLDPQGLST